MKDAHLTPVKGGVQPRVYCSFLHLLDSFLYPDSSSLHLDSLSTYLLYLHLFHFPFRLILHLPESNILPGFGKLTRIKVPSENLGTEEE